MRIGAICRFSSAMALAATLAFVPPAFADDDDDSDGEFDNGAVGEVADNDGEDDGDFSDSVGGDDFVAPDPTAEGPGNQGLPPLQVSFDGPDIEPFRGAVDRGPRQAHRFQKRWPR
ncbi:MAG: hypothetical protein IH905_12085 [Proteobacteria bacterium]|nr:hypothetical protein [Pseudomonadota bacterium]